MMDKNKFKNWIPAVLVMTIIFIFSSTPGSVINEMGFGNENLHVSGHSIMFFVLCFAFYKATKDAYISTVLTSIYGILDEFHQISTVLRSASYKDIYTDTISAVLAGLILWKLLSVLPKKLENWLSN